MLGQLDSTTGPIFSSFFIPDNVTPAGAAPGGYDTPLPSRLASFYRWVWKLSQQEGFCWACTGYLARKQGVSERTVYRWLSDLRRLGYISSEQTPGVERRITPHKEPSRPKKMSGVRQGSVSGVSSSSGSDALKEAATAANTVAAAGGERLADVEAVAALRSAGMSEAVASRIVCGKGRKAVLDAVAAYRAARNVRNPVGWLIRAVEQGYRHVPKDALEGPWKARRVPVAVEPVVSSTGLHGYAAVVAMRERLTGKGSGAPSAPRAACP